MFLAMLGPWQLIIILVIVFGILFLTYRMGQKSGYIKRVKEEEKLKR